MAQLDSTELAIVVAASVANHMIMLRQPVGLSTNGIMSESPVAHASTQTSTTPRKGRSYFMNMLETLACVKAIQAEPIEAVIQREQGFEWLGG